MTFEAMFAASTTTQTTEALLVRGDVPKVKRVPVRETRAQQQGRRRLEVSVEKKDSLASRDQEIRNINQASEAGFSSNEGNTLFGATLQAAVDTQTNREAEAKAVNNNTKGLRKAARQAAFRSRRN